MRLLASLILLCFLGDCVPALSPRALAAEDIQGGVEKRKREFLARLADDWMRAGYPVQWKHAEWKHDEVEPNWAGAMAALRLERSPEEMRRACAFFEAMPLDEKVDPDMRVCEALHAYCLFRDDPDLSSPARKRLLEIVRFKPAPRRIHPSIWRFGATENHAFMGHAWRLLVAQLDRDLEAVEEMGRHIDGFITEHIKKGWLEYNSPCYVEKEAGCLILVAEWAEDPLLRRKARLGLDVLFAEHAALQLEGMLCGPACRVYQPAHDGILPEEINHNSRRDARCSGSYPMMSILFGQGEPHSYGVLGAPLLATSRYVPPRAVSLRFGPERMTVNVARPRFPLRIEETIEPLSLPWESPLEKADGRWTPFLNYWRLNPEHWFWDPASGTTGGCLRHEASLGVKERERGAHDAAIILRGGEGWTDYAFEADAFAGGGNLGLWARADMQDEGAGNGRWMQGYSFVLDPGHGKCRLWRARKDGLEAAEATGTSSKRERNNFSDPVLFLEGQLPEGVTHGRWMRLSVEVRGAEIRCRVDGKEVLVAKDRVFPSGSVGFTTYKGRDIRFDNVRVRPF